jgi:Retrotransposon gag protein
VGDAWEWCKKLSPCSIKSFDDFAKLFLKRYNHIKAPPVIVESLLDMKKDPIKKIRAYVNRFVRHMRKIEN